MGAHALASVAGYIVTKPQNTHAKRVGEEIEPPPTAWEAVVLPLTSDTDNGVTLNQDSACTAACTSPTENTSSDAELKAERYANLVAAILAVERLPLSDEEKAEIVRRLIKDRVLQPLDTLRVPEEFGANGSSRNSALIIVRARSDAPASNK
jgi:hypothetical protein